jgi:ribonuclease T2
LWEPSGADESGAGADVMPGVGLVRHEWQTPGTCTPYLAGTYFGMIRQAFQEVKVPAVDVDGTQEVRMTRDAILAGFAKVNAGFPTGSIALRSGNNRLTAVEVCMTKDLQPMACSKVRSCRANVVKITPVN